MDVKQRIRRVSDSRNRRFSGVASATRQKLCDAGRLSWERQASRWRFAGFKSIFKYIRSTCGALSGQQLFKPALPEVSDSL